MIDFSKWTSNSDFNESLNKYYEAYISQFPEEYKNVIEKLLSHLDYYNENKISEICEKYFSNISSDIINKSNFVTTILDDKNHNSAIFYIRLKSVSRYKEIYNFQQFYQEKYKNVKNFVICDDYSCSGDTMIQVVEHIYNTYYNEGNSNINIVFYPAICCKEAKDSIDEKMNDKYKQFNYCIKSVVNRECGYLTRKNILSKEELSILSSINDYCCVPKDFHYGYNESEELMSMYYGTPNNTIGFLWHKSCKTLIKPFFHRKYEGIWFNNCSKFPNYRDYSFVNDMIKFLSSAKKLNMADKKILIYKLLGYDDSVLNCIFKGKNVVDIVEKLIKNHYINYDMTKGEKVDSGLYDRINRHKLSLNSSAQSEIEMQLISLKHHL